MNEIVVDSATAEKLLTANGLAVVKSESGAVLGQFRRDTTSIPDPLSCDVSPEELRRRAVSNEPTYTTAEVLEFARSKVR